MITIKQIKSVIGDEYTKVPELKAHVNEYGLTRQQVATLARDIHSLIKAS
jgi:hypothetical protein